MTNLELCVGSKGLLTQFESINVEFMKLLEDYSGLHIITVNGRGYVVLTEDISVIDMFSKTTSAREYFKKHSGNTSKCLWFDYKEKRGHCYSIKVTLLEKK